MAYRPGSLPASFKILVTLKILAILASWVKEESVDKSTSMVSRKVMIKSKIELLTTTKSNLFQELLKYVLP